MTEAIDRLETIGLASRTRVGRKVELRITRAGVEHMQASSVLDADRVAALIAAVSARHRDEAVRGIELLAKAARSLMSKRRA